MAKKRRGAPTKSAADKKDKPLQIRATEAEKSGFSKAAKLHGLAMSAWARERLRGIARRELGEAGESVPF